MADSPMERAVRALGDRLTILAPNKNALPIIAIGALVDLRTSDPEAFGAVLAECGVDAEMAAVVATDAYRGFFLVSEGQAVIEERVVELESTQVWLLDDGRVWRGRTAPTAATPLYRVKPERSDRHTEPTCPSCGAPIHGHDGDQRKTCHDAVSGFDRGRKQHTEDAS